MPYPHILVLGASGRLGTEVVAQLTLQGYAPLTPPSHELSVVDTVALQRYLQHHRPTHIINCAAWTDVVGAELPANRELVNQLNITLPLQLARYCAAYHSRLIHISTDYVFNGESDDPYHEYSVTGTPMNVYGNSKLLGEMNVRAIAYANTVIIRTSGLYGSGDKHPDFVNRVRLGLIISAPTNIWMTPTSIPILVTTMLDHVVFNQELNGIIHMTSGGSCSWYQFADYINTYFGLDYSIIPTKTPDPKVQRPRYTVLENRRLREYGYDRFANWHIDFTRTFSCKL